MNVLLVNVARTSRVLGLFGSNTFDVGAAITMTSEHRIICVRGFRFILKRPNRHSPAEPRDLSSVVSSPNGRNQGAENLQIQIF